MNAPVAEIRLAEGALELLPLSAIAPSETAAQARRRKRYTPAALDELAASIRAVGVMQPVVVRKLTALRGLAAYELVAGERRWLASEKAGVAHVPAIVREDITDADLVALQYIENKQRETIDPLQEAETFRDLMEGAEGKSAEDLAELLGVSRAHVYNRRKLLNLQPVVLDALEAGRIDHTKALRISRTPAAKLQRKALEKALETDHRGNQVSDRELGEWMRDRLMVRLDRAPFDLDDPNMLSKKPGMFACQKSALHNLPPCTACENCSKSDPDFDAEIQAAHGDGAIVCADKPCHDAKVQYFFFRKLERARAEGRTIIEGDEARAIKPWPLAGELRGYIDLDAQAYGAQPPAHLTDDEADAWQPPTYRELLKDHPALGSAAILIDPHNDQPRDVLGGCALVVRPGVGILDCYGAWFYNFQARDLSASVARLEAIRARTKKNYEDRAALWDGICAVRDQRDHAREKVAQEVAAWFDNSAFAGCPSRSPRRR